MPKLALSDHCPCILSINVDVKPPLQLINDCTHGTFSYGHYDVNKRLRRPINIRNVHVNNFYKDLEHLSVQIGTNGEEGEEFPDYSM